MDRRKFTGIITGLTAVAALGNAATSVQNSKPQSKSSAANVNTITNILHTGISTTDIDRSIHFYRDLMGMELTYDVRKFKGEVYDLMFQFKGTYGKAATLTQGDFNIELFEFENPKPQPRKDLRPVFEPGIYHTCFQVPDVQREYERLRDAGVYFHTPPYRVDGEGIVTYGRDPDGNIVEIVELI